MAVVKACVQAQERAHAQNKAVCEHVCLSDCMASFSVLCTSAVLQACPRGFTAIAIVKVIASVIGT